jgi:hypothetical protein
MGRPRKLTEPVKINLILEKETKASAIAVALERKISVSRLFEALLFKELAANVTSKPTSSENKKTPEIGPMCGGDTSGVNELTDPVTPEQQAI